MQVDSPWNIHTGEQKNANTKEVDLAHFAIQVFIFWGRNF